MFPKLQLYRANMIRAFEIIPLLLTLGSAPITTAPDCCSVVLTVTSLLYSGYSTCSRQHNLSNARFSLQFFCASPNAFTPHSLTLATLSRGHLVQQFVSAFCLCSRRLITSSPSLSLCFCFRNFSKEVILSSLFPMGSLSQSTVPSWGSPVLWLLVAFVWYQVLLSLLPFVYFFAFIMFSVNN